MSVVSCHDMVEKVLLDILLCLPVMSLLRFKAVCKYWFSLITSSAFLREHLKHSRNNKEDNFIIKGSLPRQRIPETKIALLSCSQYKECVYDIDLSQFSLTARSVVLAGYCDGIICLAWGAEVALWNPALKQLRPIPPPLSDSRRERFFSYHAFGNDIKNNDYKLVNIWYGYWNNCDDMICNQVEVYNLRGDSFWRIIHKDDVLPFLEILNFDVISSSKSGKCFWVARCYDNTTVLLSFDFADDVFRTMSMPDENLSSRYFDLDLLDDKIVYIVEKCGDYGKAYNIWMLHEFDAENSWNIIYEVGPFYYLDNFFSRRISMNGDFLICSKSYINVKDGQIEAIGGNLLFSYNLHTQQGKYIPECSLEIRTGGLIHYNASLLSLKRENAVMTTE